ncbi:hypothetical protein AcV5_004001 [Taiwanofungus camphoratus]|nr:hypothetical protein AcV5_004001 [Antrodia cinnamomea]
MLVFLPFISLGLLASAIPLKRQGVTCQTVHTGTLSLVSTDPDSTFAANVSIHLTSQASGFLAVGNAAQFIFEQCDSPFMGYQSVSNATTTINYGHIVVGGDSDACLTTGGPTEAGSPYLIFNNQCLTEDGSAQLGQFWSLTTDSASGTLDVEFLGVSANGDTVGNDGDVSYPLQVDTYDGESAVKAAASTQPNAPSAYLLIFTS